MRTTLASEAMQFIATGQGRLSRGFRMPTIIRIAEPRTFLPHLMLGVPLAICAVALLLIIASAHFNVPFASFDPQEQLAAF